jgi:DNA-binding transcriptional LysR family regulator
VLHSLRPQTAANLTAMSFLTLDLNLLRVFDVIMSEQNLTRAADRLATTQPAVSNALKRLREALNDELFVRTAHGVKPTPRAEELWPGVRAALSELEALLAPPRFDIAALQTVFRLSMADSTASLLLPGLLRSIQAQAPGIDLRMIPLTSRDPRPMLLQSEIELAVGSFPGVVAQLSGETGSTAPVHHHRLYSGKYICIMRKDHPLAAGALTLDGYCGALHALVSFSGRAHGPADDALAALGRQRRIALSVNQFYTVGRVVADSDLISIVPRHLLKTIGMATLLTTKELPFDLPVVHVDMLWHDRDNRKAPHQWIRQVMQQIAG